MLGVIYSAVSDFATFSYPRTSCASSGICLEYHATAIEARYCPKQHVLEWNDVEWEHLIAREIELFDELERAADTCDSSPCSPTFSASEESTSFPSAASTPTLVLDEIPEEDEEDEKWQLDPDEDSGSEYEDAAISKVCRPRLGHIVPPPPNSPSSTFGDARGMKRKHNKSSDEPRKRIYRSISSHSLASVSSSTSASTIHSLCTSPGGSEAHIIVPSDAQPGTNPWKCPHCPWIQHTQRLPDFLRHQRSHFVSQSDWPCPNPKCGKGFARKDSLKRHLDNRATGCRRPPGYTVC